MMVDALYFIFGVVFFCAGCVTAFIFIVYWDQLEAAVVLSSRDRQAFVRRCGEEGRVGWEQELVRRGVWALIVGKFRSLNPVIVFLRKVVYLAFPKID